MSVRRVIRGGSYYYDSRCLRSSLRVRLVPEGRVRVRGSGFRIAIKRRKP
jgi:formylglycine-generating enzyme required for sulfatase activity